MIASLAFSSSTCLLAAGSEIPVLVSAWNGMIVQIEAAGRQGIVLAQVQQIPGLETLTSLRNLIEPSDSEWPRALVEEVIVRRVDTLLKQELADESIYEPTTDPDGRDLTQLARGRPHGTIQRQAAYIGAADPRDEKIAIPVLSKPVLYDQTGKGIGNAWICAGGQTCDSQTLAFGDRSHMSGSTSIGGRDYQQDGIYMAAYLLSDGTCVKVIAGSDGAGGHFGGAVVSSAFLQGVHAGLADAAFLGDIPNADTLFAHGSQAAEKQRSFDVEMRNAIATGAVIIIVGNQATVATAGDSMATHLTWNEAGFYQTAGYSEVEIFDQTRLGNDITSGHPKLYRIPHLKPEDRLIIGSDGLWENLLGVDYKERGAPFIRDIIKEAERLERPNQALFHNLNILAAVNRDVPERAHALVAWALENMARPGGRYQLGEHALRLPAQADPDNVFALDYRHGLVTAQTTIGVPSEFYRLLEQVGT